MTYQIHVDREARVYLARLDRRLQERIIRRLDELASEPLGPASKALINASDLRSSRVGNYRILFYINDELATIEVVTIAPRGRAYRDV